MGRFLNPDNELFREAVNSEIYVDKTELINFTNKVLNTSRKFICNSRPRRFGKSLTVNMLTAYYSKGCDSHELFSRFNIHESRLFAQHINKFDVIQIDFQCFFKEEEIGNTLNFLTQTIVAELREAYKDVLPAEIKELPDALSQINAVTGNKFVIIIDEWDMLIRSAPDDKKFRISI